MRIRVAIYIIVTIGVVATLDIAVATFNVAVAVVVVAIASTVIDTAVVVTSSYTG
jgi:hypothetical protein